MFGWLTGAWNLLKGAANALFGAIKWLVNTVLGLGDVIITLIGWMPYKRLRVQAVVLIDGKGQPLADPVAVQAALDLAKTVFHDEAHVRLIPLGPVVILAEVPPPDILTPGCDANIWGAQFTGVGAWFRDHQASTTAGTYLGYGAPVTIFVVSNVGDGKSGCAAPPMFADYTVIEPATLPGHPTSFGPPPSPEDVLGATLTLAHEIGHACNLTHAFGDGTLMQGDYQGRPKTMSRWQKAIFRGSPHVTYL